MRIFTATNGQALTVRISGELDHHTAKQARAEMDKLILSTGCEKIVFDLSELTFMDSSGLGVILGRYKLISSRGGTAELFGANRTVERILKMSGIYKIVKRATAAKNA